MIWYNRNEVRQGTTWPNPVSLSGSATADALEDLEANFVILVVLYFRFSKSLVVMYRKYFFLSLFFVKGIR